MTREEFLADPTLARAASATKSSGSLSSNVPARTRPLGYQGSKSSCPTCHGTNSLWCFACNPQAPKESAAKGLALGPAR